MSLLRLEKTSTREDPKETIGYFRYAEKREIRLRQPEKEELAVRRKKRGKRREEKEKKGREGQKEHMVVENG
ncbi:hypothetical protein GOBAR_DD03261 [Gossypium barbadense]|nr:hypothetical protein GOBAR_DD03261 [Gossypium barbadense]